MMLGSFGIEKPPRRPTSGCQSPVLSSAVSGACGTIKLATCRGGRGRVADRMTTPAFLSYAGHRFPAGLSAMWFGCTFGSRSICGMVMEMLAARGIIVGHESVGQ